MNNCSLNPEESSSSSQPLDISSIQRILNANNEFNFYITGGEVSSDGESVSVRNCTIRFENVDKEQFDASQHSQEVEQYQYSPNEDITKVRADSKFSHLRDITILETLIGNNIILPELSYYPKEFDLSTPFLLTRQRFNLLKKIINKTMDGYVLSGPHGISKSYSMYFIACYAVVNSIPLLYLPGCLSWVRAYFITGIEAAEQFLLKLIQHWNYDILLPNELSALTKGTGVVNTLVQIVENRGKQKKDSQLFLLFDEHNELFKADEDGKLPITNGYFSPYSGWNFLRISDKYTYILTIYCGSAHSSFEDNMLGGSESRIVRLKPPTQEEFDTLVENYGLDPKDKNISFVTGRMPRELKYLWFFLQKHDSSILTEQLLGYFTKRQRQRYMSRLLRLKDQLKNEGKLDLFNHTLEALTGMNFNFNGFFNSLIGRVVDQGLLYRDESGQFIPINESAKIVLLEAATTNKRLANENKELCFEQRKTLKKNSCILY